MQVLVGGRGRAHDTARFRQFVTVITSLAPAPRDSRSYGHGRMVRQSQPRSALMPIIKNPGIVMESSRKLIVAATLGSAMLISAGAFSPAAARMMLSDCISQHNRCLASCALAGWNPDSPTFPNSCSGGGKNRCDANHAACVDRAMTLKPVNATGPGPAPGVRGPASVRAPLGTAGVQPALVSGSRGAILRGRK